MKIGVTDKIKQLMFIDNFNFKIFKKEKMSKVTQSFHPQVIIVDHFDETIHQIDIKTETLLEDQSLTEETRKRLNGIRDEQIKKIGEIKELNLKHLPQKFNEEQYKEKWSHVIDDNSLEYKQKIDKIKANLILFDFVLLENGNVINGLNLWITSWYYDLKSLEFLR
jgi:hypothetical protein